MLTTLTMRCLFDRYKIFFFHQNVMIYSCLFFQFEPNFGDFSREKKRSLDILNKVTSNKPILDSNRAANQQIAAEQRIR